MRTRRGHCRLQAAATVEQQRRQRQQSRGEGHLERGTENKKKSQVPFHLSARRDAVGVEYSLCGRWPMLSPKA
eukprot:615404-Prymnesium_polylepis.2